MNGPIDEQHLAASDVLQGVMEKNTADNISFHELKVSLHERGFGILMLIFALPLGFVPPGFAIVASLPVMLFSLQMIMAFDSPWLPRWLEKKTIKRTTLATVIEKSSPVLKWSEKFLRPRWYFASSAAGERIVGIFSFVFAISVTIPLPLTNLVPGVGVAIMALGLISKDGLIIVIGMIAGTLGTLFTLLVLFMGQQFASAMFAWFAGLLS